MGRPPCCDRSNVKRGLWTAEEDAKILAYVSNHGVGNWTMVPKKAGLNRCGKSCRLRWTNYLRPDLKHESFTPEEEELIIKLHQAIDYGNISGILSTGSQMGSLNTHFLSTPEQSSSVLTGPSTSIITTTTTQPMMEQLQENSYASYNYPSWEILHQLPVTVPEKMEPHFFNEASSSCSSSSSTAFAQLSPQQSYSCQQSQTQIAHSPPFAWSEFLLSDPASSLGYQQQLDQDYFHGLLSSNYSSSAKQNDISCPKFAAGSSSHFINRVGENSFRVDDYGAGDHIGNQASSLADVSSTCGSSFVDDILDKDREMRSQFPEFLDTTFDN
ncbi:hypothetical protein Tsubulata_048810 [Turnera subulata]|uniref:Uncharacterized protein n=1 Tax=Turnera subulata TaxID=218843 RepID=A0A9Q0JEL5_9ROSI|nr:hypothetical protein Tsubulata_048810 [Turnera subulata]